MLQQQSTIIDKATTHEVLQALRNDIATATDKNSSHQKYYVMTSPRQQATAHESLIVLCDDIATATESSKYNINSFIFTK